MLAAAVNLSASRQLKRSRKLLMALSAQYKSYVADLFSPLGHVNVRSMFGGGGVYYKETMFALISDETLFLKVDESNKPAFEDEGCGPLFTRAKANLFRCPTTNYRNGCLTIPTN